MFARLAATISANGRLLAVLTIFAAVLSLIRVMSVDSAAQAPAAQSTAEREIEDKVPKQLPIRVKLRSEKEKAFKDLKNSKWLSELEIEVTNTSDKPIYFLELWVDMPEIVSPNGHKVGFTLRYGRIEFVDFDTLALPSDKPIQPGAKYTFMIAENYQRAWEAHKAREGKKDPKIVEFTFVQLSFGDGTGFNGTDAKPFPYQRAPNSLGSSCADPGRTMPIRFNS